MNTIKPDPEKYLDFHFGKKPEYSRPHTLMAMTGFCTETVQSIVSNAFASRDKESKPKTYPKHFDPLYGTAVRIKVGWLIDHRITSEEYDQFGANDIYFMLKMGVREEEITPERVLRGINSARWDILNKKLNKN